MTSYLKLIAKSAAAPAPLAIGNITNGGFDSGQTSWNITLPTCNAGDLLLMFVSNEAQTAFPDTPTNWTMVDQVAADSAAYKTLSLYSKVAVGGDSGGTVAMTASTNTGHAHIVLQVTGANTGNLDFDSSTSSNAFASAVPFPALTTSNDDLVLRAASHHASTFTAESGTTIELSDITSGNSGITVLSDDDNSTEALSGSSTSGSNWSAAMTVAIPAAA